MFNRNASKMTASLLACFALGLLLAVHETTAKEYENGDRSLLRQLVEQGAGDSARNDNAVHIDSTIHDLQKRNVDEDCNSLIGSLKYALDGYDAMYGYPLTEGIDPGFKQQIFDSSDVCSDLDFRSVRTCQTSFQSTEITSQESLQVELSRSATISGSSAAFSFSASADFQETINSMTNDHSVYITSEASCDYYRSKMPLSSSLKFSTSFLDQLRVLNSNGNEAAYMGFFENFGTHFVREMTFGSKYVLKYKMSETDYQRAQSRSLSVTAQASYEGIYSISGELSISSNEASEVAEFRSSVQRTTLTIGALPSADGEVLTWASTPPEDPLPVTYILEPIEDLFTPARMGHLGLDLDKLRGDIIRYKHRYVAALIESGIASSYQALVYKVTAFTADRTNAATGNPMTITLNGDEEQCGPIDLEKGTFRFQRGSIDTFNVKCKEKIGRLESVTVTKEGTDGWFCDKFLVEDPFSDHVYELPCHGVLLDGNDGGEPSRLFYPEYDYTVAAYTANKYWASTTDDVYITLKGELGDCEEFKFKNIDERNSIVRFERTCKYYIGDIEKIVVRIGGYDAWAFFRIVVHDMRSGRPYRFEYDDWLEQGNTEQVTLSPKPYSETGKHFRFIIYTSEAKYSESNSRKYVTLHGETGGCSEYRIPSEWLSKSSIDVYHIECNRNIRALQKVDLRIEGTDGWRVSKLYVEDLDTGVVYHLPCSGNCLLDDDGSMTLNTEFDYQVLALTTDLYWAQTSHDIHLKLVGSSGECGEYPLQTNDERNAMKSTNLECSEYVGEIEYMKVSIDGTDGWHMYELIVYDDHTKKVFELQCSCWFDDGYGALLGSLSTRTLSPVMEPCESTIGHGPHRLDCLRAWWVEAGCSADGSGSPDNAPDVTWWQQHTVQEVKAQMKSRSTVDGSLAYVEECGVVHYQVMTKTGNHVYAYAAFSQLYITLSGQNGQCEETLLEDQHETNGMKTTEVRCSSYIGHIESATIRIEGTDGWLLDYMVIYDPYGATQHTIQCDCWFDDGADALAGSMVSRTLQTP